MKPRKALFGISLGLILAGSTAPAWSYHVPTHVEISARAAAVSIIHGDPTYLAEQGLPPSTTPAYVSSVGGPTLSALAMIAYGADLEDAESPFWRFLNHFYDPQYIAGNGARGRGLDDAYFVMSGRPSPDWALEDQGEVMHDSSNGQQFSFREANRFRYLALTSAAASDRQVFASRMFESVGHVVHHLQDMGQP